MYPKLFTLRGHILSGNRFVTDDGEEIKIIPFNYILEQYYKFIPCEAYINCGLDKSGSGYIVYSIMLIEKDSSEVLSK